MLTSSQQPDREGSLTDATSIDEMGGWATVAEALLMDCARVTLLDVAEPSARQAIAAECTESLSQLVQRHLAMAAATHRREVAAEERQSEELTHQLHTVVQECESMGEQLVIERTTRAATEEELQAVQDEREALHAERAAVWHLVRDAVMSASHRRNLVSPANATLEDHVRYLCRWVRETAETVQGNATSAVTTVAPAVQRDEPPASIFQSPRASYHRLLPSAPLNPVTASLLRVKEQVQQLRGPSVAQLQQAVGAHRPLREEAVATTPPTQRRPATAAAAAIAATTTQLSADRALALSRSYTPRRSTATVLRHGSADNNGGSNVNDGVSSPPWRTHMAKLQQELKGLRRDLHTATPRS
ncbi:hypothetical protein ABB37_10075 [Leptomonas pyrrhocoris]|uniref:Uncharacterized protein n=1 Tax=Leptomonas pyrrhocoris TaxID=157538 RepID=A0A0N0VCP9_LEPPY|nr:hypothetical protein ABB37_10075 [Leptomonas pyrrhocoris]KPA73174.1 hypothetical protein ABB37_10075 [Leptomonas pyrrhocoris]|eukprot:XP_015651613.1 hypothetical protein ABB37_10075 [Leptomonas pyrrhocoris]